MQNSSELGYLLSTSTLNDLDYDVNRTSVRLLAEEKNMEGEELLIGPESFGAMIESEGYKALPSPRQPSPGKRDVLY